jgi:phage-related protein
MKAIQPLIPPLLKLVDVIARFAGDILQKLLKAVEPIIPPLLKLVTTFVDLAVKALEPLLPPLVDLVQRLLPPIVEIFQKLLDALAPILPKLGELVGVVIDFAVKALEPVIPTLTKLADVLFPALSEVLGFLLPIITDMIKWLEPFAPVLGAIAIAVGIVVAIWWIWNAALTVWAILTSPITIVILAIVAVIAAVIAIVVLVIRNFDTLKDVAIAVWNAIWGAVKAAVDFVVGFLGDMIDFVAAIPGKIWNFLKDVFRPLIDAATGAYNWVKDKVDQLVEFFVSLPDRIGKGISVIKDVILAPFKWVWNKIADGWNSTLGGLEFKVPDWVPFIGGKGWGFPKMPNWNQFGGVYSAPTLIGVGEAGRELVLPETLLRQVMREERPGPAGGGPAVVIENATFAEELDVETFLRRAAWTMATERV